jgi:leucyl-tRNA synthetase
LRTNLFQSSKRSELLALRAAQMRSSLTASERALWGAISGKTLGTLFKRQVPIAGQFIVDFLAPKLRLVIEVDGLYHARRQRADARRDERLRRLGYRVLRVQAEDVMRELPTVIARIRAELRTLGKLS